MVRLIFCWLATVLPGIPIGCLLYYATRGELGSKDLIPLVIACTVVSSYGFLSGLITNKVE